MLSNVIRFGSILLIGNLLLTGCGTASKSEQQKNYKSFLNQISQTSDPVNEDTKTFQDTVNKAINGQASTTDLYSAAKNLDDKYKQLDSSFAGMEIPDGFPDNVSSELSDIQADLSMAYSKRADGMSNFMKYLDDQKPSEMQQYKDDMNEAQSYLNDASKKILDAQIKINNEK